MAPHNNGTGRPQPPARFPSQASGPAVRPDGSMPAAARPPSDHTPALPPMVPVVSSPRLAGMPTPAAAPSPGPVATSALRVGDVIDGKYRLDGLIGEGGMGSVHRATQLAVNRPVAVKVLKQIPGVENDQLSQRFKREALATSRLRHPNTVQVIDFGETPAGMLYLVLELLEGAPLSHVVAREAPLPLERIANIGKQIAKSLAEAHELGIVHRDLKPDNVFICQYHGDNDVTKVMDFGIARLMTADVSMTRTGMMIGTPKYMAPEQAMGKKVGPTADLYALGVILYEMLTGRPPFSADSPMALAMAHVNEPPPPLDLTNAPLALADAWSDLVRALLAKKPDDRPQKASLVVGWLAQLEVEARRRLSPQVDASHTPLVGEMAPRLVTRSSSSRRRSRRKRTHIILWVAALVFMGLGGYVAYLLATPG